MTHRFAYLTGVGLVCSIAVGATFGWAAAGLAWGAAALGAITWRFTRERLPRSTSWLLALFGLCTAMFVASDAIRVVESSPGTDANVIGALGVGLFSIVIVWVVILRSRPAIETWIDGTTFVTALFTPLWLAVIHPAVVHGSGAAATVVWAVLLLAILSVGSVYVIAGGIWSPPAILLAVGVVGTVAVSLAEHLGLSLGDMPRFVPEYVTTVVVAFHPRFLSVFERGGQPEGIPLWARTWILVALVSLPLLGLAWCYVQARPVPVAVIGGSVAMLAGLVAVRSTLMIRGGIRDWSVPLSVALSALLLAAVSLPLTVLNQSAHRAQVQTIALSRSTPVVESLDPAARAELRRATKAASVAVTRQQAVADRRAKQVRLVVLAILLCTVVVVGAVLARFNVARRRDELQHQKTHDELTGLPNRAALDRQLRDGRAVPGVSGRTLVLLDLDDFKAINDSFGHGTGDAVIRVVTARLELCVRGDQLLVRTDGDAFGILLPAGHDPLVVAHRVLAALAAPVDLDGTDHRICCSIGIAAVDETGDARHTSAFRDAEFAMYQAKRISGNSIETFEADLHEQARDRLQLAADLRDAIERDGLALAYQPIVDLTSGAVAGYEALIRWDHPVRGPLTPGDFIPIAEQSALIVDLGAWVLRTATLQLAAWQRDWRDRRYVSVNVAASQISTRALEAQVSAALDASGLDPSLLLLEVTESSLIGDLDASIEQMRRIRAGGVRFALDDFGTGYSSLSYLRRFPVDVLKVDKSFIDAIHEHEGGLLVQAILNMADSFHLRVIAEGIEEPGQSALLRDFGCELGQGFHFSRPIPAAEVAARPGAFAAATAPALRVIS